ncbi:hypothetical protein HPG69_019404, partial [Diceros bicornis minor]
MAGEHSSRSSSSMAAAPPHDAFTHRIETVLLRARPHPFSPKALSGTKGPLTKVAEPAESELPCSRLKGICADRRSHIPGLTQGSALLAAQSPRPSPCAARQPRLRPRDLGSSASRGWVPRRAPGDRLRRSLGRARPQPMPPFQARASLEPHPSFPITREPPGPPSTSVSQSATGIYRAGPWGHYWGQRPLWIGVPFWALKPGQDSHYQLPFQAFSPPLFLLPVPELPRPAEDLSIAPDRRKSVWTLTKGSNCQTLSFLNLVDEVLAPLMEPLTPPPPSPRTPSPRAQPSPDPGCRLLGLKVCWQLSVLTEGDCGAPRPVSLLEKNPVHLFPTIYLIRFSSSISRSLSRFNWSHLTPLELKDRSVGLQTQSTVGSNPYFTLEGDKFLILGGSIHYFRVPREYWRDRLLKLKACGFNTVTTGIAKNEVTEFSNVLSVLSSPPFSLIFLCLVLSSVIWLLQDPKLKLRTTDKGFIEAVDKYFDHLISRVVPLQLIQTLGEKAQKSTEEFMYRKGGPIIAVQVENEYGSFDKDKDYMPYVEKQGKWVHFVHFSQQALLKRGIVELPLTSDNTKDVVKGSIKG